MAVHVLQVSISQAEWVRLAREVIVNTLFEKSGLQLKLTLSRQEDKVRKTEAKKLFRLILSAISLSLPLTVSPAPSLITEELPLAVGGLFIVLYLLAFRSLGLSSVQT